MNGNINGNINDKCESSDGNHGSLYHSYLGFNGMLLEYG